MQNGRRVVCFFFAILLMSLAVSVEVRSNGQASNHPDKIIKEGSWELRVFYRNKGTRSERQHGILLYEGKPVEATVVGEKRNTPLGLMKYYGPENSKGVPWAPTGWNFADKRTIKPSWQDKNE